MKTRRCDREKLHRHDGTTPLLPLLIVGAGPAGLATAACLKPHGIEPLVLEAGESLGNSWRHHYDRLRLQNGQTAVASARRAVRESGGALVNDDRLALHEYSF